MNFQTKEKKMSQANQDDARSNRRQNHGLRVVVFDEENLRQNKEWHEANPVTMHIDEPKTPFCTDDGSYDEEDQRQLDEDKANREEIQRATEANTQHNKALGNSRKHITHDDVNANDDDDDANKTNKISSVDSNWENAPYNKIGSEALRNQPLVFTKIAPIENVEVSSTTTTTTTIPTNKNSNEDTAALSSDQFSSSSHLRKVPVGLKLASFDETEQEKAEAVRHEVEFKTMRKAVYRDEGLKFREMMKAAQQQQDQNSEEEEEVDQD